jgi:hypothetical protein
MMTERHLLRQLSQTWIADGAVDVLGPRVVEIIAGRKFEGCETCIEGKMKEGLGGERVQSVYCKTERLDQI